MKVKIVGSGLIGTSIALALRQAGCLIQMVDQSQEAANLANKLVNGADLDAVELIIIAVDITNNSSEIIKALNENKAAIVIDVASVKSNLLDEVAKLSGNIQNFVSSHPMAGREVGGARSARADLFNGRAWIGIKSQSTSTKAKESLEFVVKNCAATLYWHTSQSHDAIVATISHLPQVVSSSLGALINDTKGEFLNLSGQGLRDVLRLANSDPQLWSQLLIANSKPVVANIDLLIAKLQDVRNFISSKNQGDLQKILVDGNNGVGKIPGKHGLIHRDYAFLTIVINDQPGQLAKIFIDCAKAEVNIEDLSIEHSPGQQTGLITLAIAERDNSKLYDHLSSCGWDLFQTKSR